MDSGIIVSEERSEERVMVSDRACRQGVNTCFVSQELEFSPWYKNKMAS